MAEAKTNNTTQRGGSVSQIDWTQFKPVVVSHEDTMDAAEVKATWQKIYRDSGYTTLNEDTQRSVRMAVYVYLCVNGTSREGAYDGKCVTKDGVSFPAAVIPRAAGKMKIRRFMRGNMEESYVALKNSKVIEEDEKYVAKVAKLGVSADLAFATGDWFTSCPKFTPSETRVHEASFTHGVERAKLARGGRALEKVEGERVRDSLAAQSNVEMGKGNEIVF